MATIYEQHSAAFTSVSAYVILKDGERVATIALKFPRDGAGRLYAYVHWLGIEMVRGHAGGYGYDKGSAAVASAVNNPALIKSFNLKVSTRRRGEDLAWHDGFHAFRSALAEDDGRHWYNRLRDAGFDVLQAV